MKIKSKLAQVVRADAVKQAFRNFDGWGNILTGLNKARDARTSSCATWYPMRSIDIENLYAADAMAKKIVREPVAQALDKGFTFCGIKPEESQRLVEALNMIRFQERNYEAACDGRQYGGSALFMVTDSMVDLSMPMQPTERIINLINFNRFDLFTDFEMITKNVRSSNFGKPAYYSLYRSSLQTDVSFGQRIHYSRMMIYNGTKLPYQNYQNNGYWHDSILNALQDALRNYNTAHESANATLKDFSVGVYKVRGLMEAIAGSGESAVMTRLTLIDTVKSIVRSIVVDADGESFEWSNRTVTGLVDLVSKAEDRLAAESGIPKTILFGTSPQGGLGQSGNHESENWYNTLGAYRENELKPTMMPVIKHIAAGIGIDPNKIEIKFTPFWTMSEKETVEMRKIQAEGDVAYINAGVLDPSEVAKSRFGNGSYSIETSVDLGLRKEEPNAFNNEGE